MTVSSTDPVVDRDVARDLSVAALDLARRFAAGATMWCVCDQWPAHGRHVAVEFVHPVIVGKRALPAVSVEGTERIDTLRLLARSGDVLLAVSTADHGPTRELLARAQTWGLERFWLGAGDPPEGTFAEHVIWLRDRDPSHVARSGEIVLLYHLLWELTHVVFEHPGLLSPPAVECTDDVCITCSDEGHVGEISSLDGDDAEVFVRGRVETVDVSLVRPIAVGDLVLVHANVALAKLDALASYRGEVPS